MGPTAQPRAHGLLQRATAQARRAADRHASLGKVFFAVEGRFRFSASPNALTSHAAELMLAPPPWLKPEDDKPFVVERVVDAKTSAADRLLCGVASMLGHHEPSGVRAESEVRVLWADAALLPPAVRQAWRDTWVEIVRAQCEDKAPGSLFYRAHAPTKPQKWDLRDSVWLRSKPATPHMTWLSQGWRMKCPDYVPKDVHLARRAEESLEWPPEAEESAWSDTVPQFQSLFDTSMSIQGRLTESWQSRAARAPRTAPGRKRTPR